MDDKIYKMLNLLEPKQGEENFFWNIPPETGKFLHMLLTISRAKTMLEVGTSNGYSGLWFADALRQNLGKLYTVESHRERFALAEKHFQEAEVTDVVEQIFGHAPEIFFTDAFKTRALQFDVIFLDATKVEYASYFEAVLPFLKPGGLLVADNVNSHRAELGSFFKILSQNTAISALEVPIGSGLLFGLKKE